MKPRGRANRQVQRWSQCAPERSFLGLVKGGASNRLVLSTFYVATLFALGLAPARAQDATWLPSPSTESFNDGVNWTTGVVPTGTAFFGESGQTAPLIEADTPLNQIQFTSSATSEYTIGVGFVGPATLTLSGPGITNLSSNPQGIELGSSGTLILNSGSTAGDNNTHYTNLGGAIVFNSSTAGSADFQNENSNTTTVQSLSTIAMRALARSTTTPAPSLSIIEATLTASNSSAEPLAPAPSFSVAVVLLAARKSKS